RNQRRLKAYSPQATIRLPRYFGCHCLGLAIWLLIATIKAVLSSRSKYAIHSLIYLAHRYGQGLVAIRDIAQAEEIPRKFLEAILLDLKGDGILSSRPGPSGGYALRVPPEKLTLGQIVRILEGPLALTPCV